MIKRIISTITLLAFLVTNTGFAADFRPSGTTNLAPPLVLGPLGDEDSSNMRLAMMKLQMYLRALDYMSYNRVSNARTLETLQGAIGKLELIQDRDNDTAAPAQIKLFFNWIEHVAGGIFSMPASVRKNNHTRAYRILFSTKKNIQNVFPMLPFTKEEFKTKSDEIRKQAVFGDLSQRKGLPSLAAQPVDEETIAQAITAKINAATDSISNKEDLTLPPLPDSELRPIAVLEYKLRKILDGCLAAQSKKRFSLHKGRLSLRQIRKLSNTILDFFEFNWAEKFGKDKGMFMIPYLQRTKDPDGITKEYNALVTFENGKSMVSVYTPEETEEISKLKGAKSYFVRDDKTRQMMDKCLSEYLAGYIKGFGGPSGGMDPQAVRERAREFISLHPSLAAASPEAIVDALDNQAPRILETFGDERKEKILFVKEVKDEAEPRNPSEDLIPGNIMSRLARISPESRELAARLNKLFRAAPGGSWQNRLTNFIPEIRITEIIDSVPCLINALRLLEDDSLANLIIGYLEYFKRIEEGDSILKPSNRFIVVLAKERDKDDKESGKIAQPLKADKEKEQKDDPLASKETLLVLIRKAANFSTDLLIGNETGRRRKQLRCLCGQRPGRFVELWLEIINDKGLSSRMAIPQLNALNRIIREVVLSKEGKDSPNLANLPLIIAAPVEAETNKSGTRQPGRIRQIIKDLHKDENGVSKLKFVIGMGAVAGIGLIAAVAANYPGMSLIADLPATILYAAAFITMAVGVWGLYKEARIFIKELRAPQIPQPAPQVTVNSSLPVDENEKQLLKQSLEDWIKKTNFANDIHVVIDKNMMRVMMLIHSLAEIIYTTETIVAGKTKLNILSCRVEKGYENTGLEDLLKSFLSRMINAGVGGAGSIRQGSAYAVFLNLKNFGSATLKELLAATAGEIIRKKTIRDDLNILVKGKVAVVKNKRYSINESIPPDKLERIEDLLKTLYSEGQITKNSEGEGRDFAIRKLREIVEFDARDFLGTYFDKDGKPHNQRQPYRIAQTLLLIGSLESLEEAIKSSKLYADANPDLLGLIGRRLKSMRKVASVAAPSLDIVPSRGLPSVARDGPEQAKRAEGPAKEISDLRKAIESVRIEQARPVLDSFESEFKGYDVYKRLEPGTEKTRAAIPDESGRGEEWFLIFSDTKGSPLPFVRLLNIPVSEVKKLVTEHIRIDNLSRIISNDVTDARTVLLAKMMSFVFKFKIAQEEIDGKRSIVSGQIETKVNGGNSRNNHKDRATIIVENKILESLGRTSAQLKKEYEEEFVQLTGEITAPAKAEAAGETASVGENRTVPISARKNLGEDTTKPMGSRTMYGGNRMDGPKKTPAKTGPDSAPLIGKYAVYLIKTDDNLKNTGKGTLIIEAFDIVKRKDVTISINAERAPPGTFSNFKRTDIPEIDTALDTFLKDFAGETLILEENEYGIHGIGTANILAIQRKLKDNKIALFHEPGHGAIASGNLQVDTLISHINDLPNSFKYSMALKARKYVKKEFYRNRKIFKVKRAKFIEYWKAHYALILFQGKLWNKENKNLTYSIRGRKDFEALLFDNPWMKHLCTRSSADDRGIFEAFIKRDHPIKIEVFSAIDKLSNGQILKMADDALSGKGEYAIVPDIDKFIFDKNSGKPLALKELFLRPTVGERDLSQILLQTLTYCMSPKNIKLYMPGVGMEFIKKAVGFHYLIIRALAILSQRTDITLISDKDVDSLSAYIKDGYAVEHNILLSLAGLIVPADTKERQESLKNLLVLIDVLKKRSKKWAGVFAKPDNKARIDEMRKALSNITPAKPETAYRFYSLLPQDEKTDALYSLVKAFNEDANSFVSEDAAQFRRDTDEYWSGTKDKHGDRRDALIGYVNGEPAVIYGFGTREDGRLAWGEGIYVAETARRNSVGINAASALLSELKTRGFDYFYIGNNYCMNSSSVRDADGPQEFAKKVIARFAVDEKDIHRWDNGKIRWYRIDLRKILSAAAPAKADVSDETKGESTLAESEAVRGVAQNGPSPSDGVIVPASVGITAINPVARVAPKAFVFDLDGTISRLRDGWEQILASMAAAVISGTALTDAELADIINSVKNREPLDKDSMTSAMRRLILSGRISGADMKWGIALADRTRGEATPLQYDRAIKEAAERGVTPALTSAQCTAIHQRLVDEVRDYRAALIETGAANAKDFMLPGIGEILSALCSGGIKCYIATGGSQEGAERDLKNLGLRQYITKIYGYRIQSDTDVKYEGIKEVIAESGIRGEEVVVIGDGIAEMSAGRKLGCVTALIKYISGEDCVKKIITAAQPNYFIDGTGYEPVAEALNVLAPAAAPQSKTKAEAEGAVREGAAKRLLNSRGETFDDVWKRLNMEELVKANRIGVCDPRNWPIDSDEERDIAVKLSQATLAELESRYNEIFTKGGKNAPPSLKEFIDALSESATTIEHYFRAPFFYIKVANDGLAHLKQQGRLTFQRESDIRKDLSYAYLYKAFLRELATRWSSAPAHLPVSGDSEKIASGGQATAETAQSNIAAPAKSGPGFNGTSMGGMLTDDPAGSINKPAAPAESEAVPVRSLGKTGLSFPVLGIGTVWFGRQWPPDNKSYVYPEFEEVKGYLDMAFEKIGAGNTMMVDTAAAYGLSEEVVGRYFDENQGLLARAFIATKWGEEYDITTGKSVIDHSKESLKSSVKRSIERLGKLDLLYIHGTTLEVLRDKGVMEEMQRMKDEHYGGLRLIGASISREDVLEGAVKYNLIEGLDAIQIPASIFLARPDLTRIIREKGIAIVLNSPIRKGDGRPAEVIYDDLLQREEEAMILTGTRTHLKETIGYCSQRSIPSPEKAEAADACEGVAEEVILKTLRFNKQQVIEGLEIPDDFVKNLNLTSKPKDENLNPEFEDLSKRTGIFVYSAVPLNNRFELFADFVNSTRRNLAEHVYEEDKSLDFSMVIQIVQKGKRKGVRVIVESEGVPIDFDKVLDGGRLRFARNESWSSVNVRGLFLIRFSRIAKMNNGIELVLGNENGERKISFNRDEKTASVAKNNKVSLTIYDKDMTKDGSQDNPKFVPEPAASAKEEADGAREGADLDRSLPYIFPVIFDIVNVLRVLCDTLSDYSDVPEDSPAYKMVDGFGNSIADKGHELEGADAMRLWKTFSYEKSRETYRNFARFVKEKAAEIRALLPELKSFILPGITESAIEDNLKQAENFVNGIEILLDESRKEVDVNETISRMIGISLPKYYEESNGENPFKYDVTAILSDNLPHSFVEQNKLSYALLNMLVLFRDCKPGEKMRLDISTMLESSNGINYICIGGKSNKAVPSGNVVKADASIVVGLPAARKLIEDLGGTIVFQSELGKGTTFTIRLPIFSAPARLSASGEPVQIASGGQAPADLSDEAKGESTLAESEAETDPGDAFQPKAEAVPSRDTFPIDSESASKVNAGAREGAAEILENRAVSDAVQSKGLIIPLPEGITVRIDEDDWSIYENFEFRLQKCNIYEQKIQRPGNIEIPIKYYKSRGGNRVSIMRAGDLLFIDPGSMNMKVVQKPPEISRVILLNDMHPDRHGYVPETTLGATAGIQFSKEFIRNRRVINFNAHTGVSGLACADSAREIIFVEENSSNHRNIVKNMARNNVTNYKVFEGSEKEFVPVMDESVTDSVVVINTDFDNGCRLLEEQVLPYGKPAVIIASGGSAKPGQGVDSVKKLLGDKDWDFEVINLAEWNSTLVARRKDITLPVAPPAEEKAAGAREDAVNKNSAGYDPDTDVLGGQDMTQRNKPNGEAAGGQAPAKAEAAGEKPVSRPGVEIIHKGCGLSRAGKRLGAWARKHQGQKLDITGVQLAGKYGLSDVSVYLILKRYNIETLGSEGRPKGPGSRRLHTWASAHRGETVNVMLKYFAKKYGLTRWNVAIIFKKYGIKTKRQFKMVQTADIADKWYEIKSKIDKTAYSDVGIDRMMVAELLEEGGAGQVPYLREKDTLIISKIVTFDEGLGPLLPHKADAGVKIAVITENDRQDELIREMNRGRDRDKWIKYGRSIDDVKSKCSGTTKFYYVMREGEIAPKGMTSLIVKVKQIYESLEKVCGVDKESIRRLGELRRPFNEAA